MEMMVSEGKKVNFRGMDKVYFEDKGILKGDVVDYYANISSFLLPHLKDRPISMIHFPSASVENSFYQKQKPNDAPLWVQTVKIDRSGGDGAIEWCMVNDLATLLYMVNRSVLEMHAWFSRCDNLDKPDLAVLDLDPSGNSGVKEAAIVALEFKKELDKRSLYSMIKTSGSKGLHIFVPIAPIHDYDKVQEFLKRLCVVVQKRLPSLCTLERTKAKRGDRVYLDAVQCGRGKTLAMPYSLRVKSGALVSTPLMWEEVNESLDVKRFDMHSIFDRIDKVGDLAKNLYDYKQKL